MLNNKCVYVIFRGSRTGIEYVYDYGRIGRILGIRYGWNQLGQYIYRYYVRVFIFMNRRFVISLNKKKL